MRQLRPLIAAITLTILGAMVVGCAGPPQVGPPQAELLQAEFEASVTSGQAPLSITFSNTSKNADEFQWDFGDDTTATSSTVQEPVLHQYTKAGTHTVTLTAIRKGEPPETSTATLTITVNPGALDAVTIPPTIEVAAGGTEQLEAIATDQYDNRVSEVDVAWTLLEEDVGSLTQAGVLTASEVAGSFSDVVEVQVTQGELVSTAVASIAITPGPLEQVVIAPNSVEIGMEMAQQFVVVAADRYGNRISGLTFTWSVENGGGSIDEAGLFKAGTTPDTYKDTVKAETTQGDITRSATASITVEPDRITFISDRNDDQRDIYIMDIDGTNVERLTTTSAQELRCSWSPDGRRIVYESHIVAGGILVMNDDGSWKIRLINNKKEVAHVNPAWSPDGSKVAFIKATYVEGKTEESNLFVMDVDGGNVTHVTNTYGIRTWPAWSPDGTKMAYAFKRKPKLGETRDIYVINADGSNRQQLTSNPADDTRPAWSPDGTQIAFVSNRRDRERHTDAEIYVMNADGSNERQLTSNTLDDIDPAWSPDGSKIVFVSERATAKKGEICVMDTDGSNVTRLTNNSAVDVRPGWAPRKSGVEVTEASVIIPGASTLKGMTTQEVTAQSSKAVVRIKTDLGSGSGFIVDPSGLILTNNHVISDAEEITVYLEDGTSYDGSIQARDLVRDLALVKIWAAELSYLELGDLSQVGLGQQVVVLGYALGAENVAVTSGLVSAIDFDSGRNITWVQTDSVINPGNSGGPMLNLQGRVIGVVSAKLVGFGIEGVGFAISANTVNTYLPRLEAGEIIMTFR